MEYTQEQKRAFCNNFRWRIGEWKLSQGEVAELLNISQPQVSMYARGKTFPKEDMLITICDKMHFTLDSIFETPKAETPVEEAPSIVTEDTNVEIVENFFKDSEKVGIIFMEYVVQCEDLKNENAKLKQTIKELNEKLEKYSGLKEKINALLN